MNKPNDVKPYPENLDEDFLRELWFIKNESSVTSNQANLIFLPQFSPRFSEIFFTSTFFSTEDFVNIKIERQLKLIRAKEEKSLFECQCCFDDQLLFEDMVACEKAHLFCR